MVSEVVGMGIFSKKQATEPSPAPEIGAKAEPKISQEYERFEFNLTDKMIRVEIDGDDAFVGFGEVKSDGDRIKIVSSGRILIAEVGKRGKAYKELEPLVGKQFESVVIKPKTGEYGDYYRVTVKVKGATVVTME